MRRVNTWRAPKWLRLWMMAATRGGDGWLWYALGIFVLAVGGPERYAAVIAKGDELLDWREMCGRYAGATIRLGYAEALYWPLLLLFIGLFVVNHALAHTGVTAGTAKRRQVFRMPPAKATSDMNRM